MVNLQQKRKRLPHHRCGSLSYFAKLLSGSHTGDVGVYMICNQQVIGSSPIIGFENLRMDSRAAKGGRL